MKRNYGIDLLRIIAMFFVIILHIVGVGGICANAELLSVNFLTSQFLRTATFCAVNIYALISGFVGWNRKPKLSGLLNLWLKVICFCLFATVFTWLRDDALVGWADVTKALSPVKNATYWYFSAYVGLFFFSPILNHAARSITPGEARLAVGGLSLITLALWVSKIKDVFLVANGYSTLWLMVMYLFGALMARFEIHKKLSARKWALLFLLAVLANWLPRMVMLYCKPEYWTPANQNLKLQYTSPTVILAAVAMVGWFARLTPGPLAEKVISKVSPHAFGVYLFHTHTLIFLSAIRGQFIFLASASTLKLLLVTFGAAVFIFALGAALDWLLTLAIRALRIDRLLKWPDRFF